MVGDPGDASGFFGVMSDGTVIRAVDRGRGTIPIAEKLPPAYDLVALP